MPWSLKYSISAAGAGIWSRELDLTTVHGTGSDRGSGREVDTYGYAYLSSMTMGSMGCNYDGQDCSINTSIKSIIYDYRLYIV